jgi:hypothetical protein
LAIAADNTAENEFVDGNFLLLTIFLALPSVFD